MVNNRILTLRRQVEKQFTNVFVAVIICFSDQRIRSRKMKERFEGSQGNCQEWGCDTFLKRNVMNTKILDMHHHN